MNLLRDDIIAITREVVRLWPYSLCNQLDTFAIVDNVSELETKNLGKTYQDYTNGHFWSRKWVLGGADPATLQKTYPMLILEQKNVTKNDPFDNEVCWDWWFVFTDIPDCADCGECNRTKDTIDSELQVTALQFLEYLYSINLYTFDGTDLIWTSKAQADKYVADGLYAAYSSAGYTLPQFVSNSPLTINPGSLGLTDAARSVIFSLRICTCVADGAPLETFNANTVDKPFISQPCTIC